MMATNPIDNPLPPPVNQRHSSKETPESQRQSQEQEQEQGEPSQPLRPPLPPAQSSPPRQPAPDQKPRPDAPRDQRYREGEDQDVPATLTPEQRTALVTEPHPPQKFKRPLPQPGDPDYVAGQPVNEEEAARVEHEDEERYKRGQQFAKEAESRRLEPREDDQHPGSIKRPDDGGPLHKPGKGKEQK